MDRRIPVRGWDCIGIDIERHDYGTGGYPGTLLLQDMRTIHGRQFKHANAFCFSPPCQDFSYMAMPWSLGKKKAAAIREDFWKWYELTDLFVTCFRIHQEACEAAGHHIPMIVENVRGAQEWVGRSSWHYGSFHLWGDVPALMPRALDDRRTGKLRHCDDGMVKVAGLDWSKFGTEGYRPQGFNVTAAQNYREGLKLPGNNAPRRWENRDVQRLCDAGTKQGGDWSNSEQPSLSRMFSSKSDSRKAASAQIAKIPFPLARHIAKCFKPY